MACLESLLRLSHQPNRCLIILTIFDDASENTVTAAAEDADAVNMSKRLIYGVNLVQISSGIENSSSQHCSRLFLVNGELPRLF